MARIPLPLDPFARLDPLASGLPSSRRRWRRRAPTLSDLQEESLIKQLTRTGASGLARTANVLDLIGSSARDILMLENPLDQWMPGNWTSPENRVGGRESLERLGFLGPNKKGLDAGDVAGFLYEVGTDPLTYLTLGGSALTKAGRIAKSAGLLGKAQDIAQVGKRASRMRLTPRDILRAESPISQVGKQLPGDLGIFQGSLKAPTQVDAAKWLLESPGQRKFREAAAKAGVNVADILDQPLGGLAGIRVPFAKDNLAVFGKAGGKAESVAHGMDVLGGAISRSLPGRAVRSLFDPRVKGLFSKSGQELAELSTKYKEPGVATAKTKYLELIDELQTVRRSFAEEFGDAISLRKTNAQQMQDLRSLSRFNEVYGDAAREALEARGLPANRKAVRKMFSTVKNAAPKVGAEQALRDAGIDPLEYATELTDEDFVSTFDAIVRHAVESNVDEALERFVPGAKGKKATVDQISGVASSLRKANEEIFGQLKRKGIKADFLGVDELVQAEKATAHFPRSVDTRQQSLAAAVRHKVAATGGTATAARTKATRMIPTDIVNQMTSDKSIRAGGNLERSAEAIFEKYTQYLSPSWEGNRFSQTGGKKAHSYALANWLKGRPVGPLYTSRVPDDELRYLKSAYTLNASADAIHEFLGRNVGGGEVSLADVFRAADMDVEQSLKYFTEKTGKSADQFVPREVADAIGTLIRPQTQSEWGALIGETIDRFHRMFKSSVTVVFPAFLSRNLTSGLYMNLASGNINTVGEVAEYGNLVRRAMPGVGKGPRQWAQEFTEETGIDLVRELEIHDVIQREVGVEGVEFARTQDESFFPGAFRNSLEEIRQLKATKLPETSGLPRRQEDWILRAEGVPRPEDRLLNRVADEASRIAVPEKIDNAVRAGVRAGTKANWHIEFLNKAPMYAYLRKKGWAAEAAAAEVKKLQVDYSALSPFEKTYMKRVFPFYSFTRRISPVILSTLMERPGGVMGRTITTTGRAHSENELVPDYVAQGASVPLGTTDDGSARYITGLGLPFEDPLSFVGGLREGGLEALSRATPLAKGPLEWATGQTFFQRGPTGGRPLEDLDPTYGRIQSNVKQLVTGEETKYAQPILGSRGLEALLGNLPTSRLGTTVRQMTDPRKHEHPLALASNLFTGVRMTDISPAAQDAVERELSQAFMKKYLRGREFTKTYIPDEAKARMDPTTLQSALLYEALQNKLRGRQKERNLLSP